MTTPAGASRGSCTEFLGHVDLDPGATEGEIQSLHYKKIETYLYSTDGYLARVDIACA